MNKEMLENVCKFLEHLEKEERDTYLILRNKLKKTINPYKRYLCRLQMDAQINYATGIRIAITKLREEWEYEKKQAEIKRD